MALQPEFLWAAMALLAGTALLLSFRHWKAKRADPKRVDKEYLRRLLSEGADPKRPKQKAQKIDPRIANDFNKVFMTTTKESKEALIKRWTDKGHSRGEAMRLAVEEWRRDNR